MTISSRLRSPAQPAPARAGWRSGPGEAAEREADRAALEVSRGESAESLRAVPREAGTIPDAVCEALRSPGQPLDASLRDAFEPRFGHDFSRVRIHADTRAAESARALGARAFTTGQDIVFGAGRYDPASRSGRTLIAHELAHVVQQGRHRPARPALQLKSELEDLPEDERKKVRVEPSGLDEAGQKALDGIYLGNAGFPLPADMSIRFGASVPAFRHKGLTQVVGSLVRPTAPGKPAFLPKNTAFSMAIPAAHAIFRFSRLDRPSQAQAGAAAPPEVVLVEETGPIPQKPKPIWEAFPGPFPGAQGPLPGPQAAQMRECQARGADLEFCRWEVLGIRPPGMPPATPMALPEESRLKVRDVLLKRGTGWKEDDWEQVTEVMSGLPDPVLKELAGVELRRLPAKVCAAADVQAGTCSPNRAAETDNIRRTITFFDKAFVKTSTRYGVSTELYEFFVHEIGHLADFAPLRTAWAASDRGRRNEARLLAARSRSGSAWVKHVRPGPDQFQHTEVGGGLTGGTFREAAIQDGLTVQGDKIASGGVTPYGNTGWQELFAESYALYYTDPDLLKAIRPKVFAFLERTLPK